MRVRKKRFLPGGSVPGGPGVRRVLLPLNLPEGLLEHAVRHARGPLAHEAVYLAVELCVSRLTFRCLFVFIEENENEN